MKTTIILALLLASFSAFPSIYKCKNLNGEIEFSDQPCTSNDKELLEVKPDYQHSTSPGTGLSLEERRMLRRIEKREQQRYYNRNLEQHYPEQDTTKVYNYQCDHYKSKIAYYEDRLRKGCRSYSCERFRDRKRYYAEKLYQECR